MILFPRRIAGYLAKSVLLATLAAWAVLLGFVTIIDFVSELATWARKATRLAMPCCTCC